MSDLSSLLAWGRRQRERVSQRAAAEAKSHVSDAAVPVARELWRSTARYSRTACSWEEAGVVTDSVPSNEPRDDEARARAVDLHICVQPSGSVVATINPVEDLSPATRHGVAPDARVMEGGDVIELTMVSQQQLFAHQLYPSAVAIARLFDAHRVSCEGLSLLELGAGPALPCVIAALNGACAIVASDFPDAAMLDNTAANLDANLPPRLRSRCRVVGHAWGRGSAELLSARREILVLLEAEREPSLQCAKADLWSAGGDGRVEGFEMIVLSDLLYELEHHALLTSCVACLAPTPDAQVLVAFQPHDPVNLHRQRAFFELAQGPPFHLACVERISCTQAPRMFRPQRETRPQDDSPATLVHLYSLRRQRGASQDM